MAVAAAGALVVAFFLDSVVAEPPARVHPVALFGRFVGACDRMWRYPQAAGLAVAVFVPLAAAVVVGGTVHLVTVSQRGIVTLALEIGIAGVWLFTTTSRRMLVDVARDVLNAVTANPDAARESIRALVGRDTAALSPSELRSGAVESAAENLSDGVVAPLLAFIVGAQVSLAVAAAAAAWVKAVNTLDSILGYPSKPHGTASARLDDLVMWVPARASAALLAVAALDPSALARAAASASVPSSPNAGWPMATLAAAIEVRLTKHGAYTLNADATLPTDDRARCGVRVVDRAAVLAFVLAGVVAWC